MKGVRQKIRGRRKRGGENSTVQTLRAALIATGESARSPRFPSCTRERQSCRHGWAWMDGGGEREKRNFESEFTAFN